MRLIFFYRGCSCEDSEWSPKTHRADVWDGLLFISLARYRREGVFVPVLSVEHFYEFKKLSFIDKRVERVIGGERKILVYWWDAYYNQYFRISF